jgi:hypothetical protein
MFLSSTDLDVIVDVNVGFMLDLGSVNRKIWDVEKTTLTFVRELY